MKDGFWYGRGRMSGPGTWHTLKRLELETWQAETWCGASVVTIRRSLPPKAKACFACRKAIEQK